MSLALDMLRQHRTIVVEEFSKAKSFPASRVGKQIVQMLDIIIADVEAAEHGKERGE